MKLLFNHLLRIQHVINCISSHLIMVATPLGQHLLQKQLLSHLQLKVVLWICLLDFILAASQILSIISFARFQTFQLFFKTIELRLSTALILLIEFALVLIRILQIDVKKWLTYKLSLCLIRVHHFVLRNFLPLICICHTSLITLALQGLLLLVKKQARVISGLVQPLKKVYKTLKYFLILILFKSVLHILPFAILNLFH